MEKGESKVEMCAKKEPKDRLNGLSFCCRLSLSSVVVSGGWNYLDIINVSMCVRVGCFCRMSHRCWLCFLAARYGEILFFSIRLFLVSTI